MTPEQIAEIERAAHECDPAAWVEWDRSHETLTITCSSECTEAMRAAVEPHRTPESSFVLVIRRRT